MWLIILILIIVWVCYFKNYVYQKRKSYVLEYSPAIKALKDINTRYEFKPVPNFDMVNNYDNDAFYQTISPEDYLTYQLVYKGSAVRLAIKDAKENKRIYATYQNQISDNCSLGQIESGHQIQKDILIRIEQWLHIDYIFKKEHLVTVEEEVFNSLIIKPTVSFGIIITLRRTNINGRLLTYKSSKFDTEAIEDILNKLAHKYDGRYLDDNIWQTICRVERGRVSNKMRFSIYERDGHRCRKCGRYSNNLEIDHIFPISKGGKSEYNNLQTLCHECNVKKSNTVERGAINPKSKRQGVNISCELCGAPMVIVKGKYGEFYGCSNYPKCRFTKKK